MAPIDFSEVLINLNLCVNCQINIFAPEQEELLHSEFQQNRASQLVKSTEKDLIRNVRYTEQQQTKPTTESIEFRESQGKKQFESFKTAERAMSTPAKDQGQTFYNTLTL